MFFNNDIDNLCDIDNHGAYLSLMLWPVTVPYGGILNAESALCK
jgi:hypothetical protein